MYLALLLAYAGGLTALGWWAGRRATAGDFFVAGRTLPATLLAATLLAANIGAGSTVGAAGLGYRDGIAAWWWVGAAGLGSIVLALSVGPRIWRVAADADLRTLGDYLERRFDRRVRGLMAGLLWIGSLAILAAQLIALSTVLSAVAGIPRAAGIAFGGLIMTAYFTAGGLLSTASVNLVQVIVLVAGLLAAVPYAWSAVGGWAGLSTMQVPADYWNPWRGGRSGLVFLPLLAPSFIVSPGILQKVYGARDARAVRLGVLVNGVVLLVFAAIPPLLGIMSHALHPTLANAELALPTLLRQDLPPALGALALAALFSAEISTCDAILFMLSTSITRDLYRGHLRPQATDAEQLRVARLAAIGSGLAGIAIAVLAGTIVETMTFFYGVLSAGLFVPVVAGLYLRRAGAPEALASMGGGAAVTFALEVTGASPFGMSPVVWGLASSVCGLVALRVARGGEVSRGPTPR